MLKISEYTKRSADLTTRALEELKAAGVDYSIQGRGDSSVRLVFAGQYSAGKSSILKMLTGNEDIEIGPGITTQKAHTYEWNGMEVIDTPGIHTEKRPDHDEISYSAIAAADMLVFVITNELFDSHLAEHFRKLAITQDKAGEMILVVNKMNRANDGNSAAQQEIIREDLRKVLEPYTPEQLHLCFLDAESYLDSLKEEDPEIVEELQERSGYSDFIATLNYFVAEKKVYSKLTTELYQVEELLQKGIHALEPRASDDDVDALMEVYLQQRHALVDGRIRLQQEIRGIFSSAATQIRNLGLDSANLIVEGCKQDEVEDALAEQIRKADTIIDNCQNNAVDVLDKRLQEMGHAQDSIAQSEFTKELVGRLSGKFNALPENIQNLLQKAGPGLQNAGQYVVGKAYNEGLDGGLKLANFAKSDVHDIVIKAGHFIGYKFKPWQAVKIAKGIGIAGKALGVLGVGLNVFMQIKADQDEDRMRIELQRNRQNIRSQFNSAATELEDFGTAFIEANVTEVLDEPIQELDTSIQEIRSTKKNRSIACQNMEALQGECRTLIQDIHNIA